MFHLSSLRIVSPLLLVLLAMAMIGPRSPAAQAETASLPVFACHELQRLSWAEMDAAQQQLAHNCDAAEAHQQWEAAYGQMETQEWALAAVHEPL